MRNSAFTITGTGKTPHSSSRGGLARSCNEEPAIMADLFDRSRFHVPYVIFGMRIAAALLFFRHGAEKLFGFAGARPVPDLHAQRGIAGLLETIGPALLVIGLFPRFTVFILCGEMAVAYFQSWGAA